MGARYLRRENEKIIKGNSADGAVLDFAGGNPIECVAIFMQPSSLKEISTIVTQNKILIRDIFVSIQ